MAGRENPYCLKWVSIPPRTTGWYSRTGDIQIQSRGGFTFWFKFDSTFDANSPLRGGLFGYTQTGQTDLLSVSIGWGGAGNPSNAISLHVRDPSGVMATSNSASGASAIVLGTTWHNYCVRIDGGLAQAFIDGNPIGTALAYDPLLESGGISAQRVGAAEPVQNLIDTPDNISLDEWAFFSGDAPDPVKAYNSGVPRVWSNVDLGIQHSLALEKATGAISKNAIPIDFKIPSSTASPFVWYGPRPNIYVELSTDALRKTDTNAFIQLATHWGDWTKGVLTGGYWAIGSGAEMRLLMPAAMPFPAGGGFNNLGYSGAFVGNKEQPHSVPVITDTGSFVRGTDSVSYPANGGTGSLNQVNNTRNQRILYPTFMKKI
tara:strand:- start:11190 stop:12311 length:1122 start_codon:yes stop_codon:yes gene_type:complete